MISAGFCKNFFPMSGSSDMTSNSVLSCFLMLLISFGLCFYAYCFKYLICCSKNMASIFDCSYSSIASAPFYSAFLKSSAFPLSKHVRKCLALILLPAQRLQGAILLVCALLACESGRSCFNFHYFAMSAFELRWLSVLHSALKTTLETTFTI